jgi:hypothetical protein
MIRRKRSVNRAVIKEGTLNTIRRSDVTQAEVRY